MRTLVVLVFATVVLTGCAGSGVADGNVTIATADDVTKLAKVTEISGDLVVAPGLTSLTLPDLARVGGSILVEGTDLTSFSAPLLATVIGGFNVYINNALTSIDIPALSGVTEVFFVNYNPALASFAIPSLQGVGSSFNVNNNATLKSLDAPLLTHIGGAFLVSGNTPLRQCQVDAILHGLSEGPSSVMSTGNNGMPNVCP